MSRAQMTLESSISARLYTHSSRIKSWFGWYVTMTKCSPGVCSSCDKIAARRRFCPSCEHQVRVQLGGGVWCARGAATRHANKIKQINGTDRARNRVAEGPELAW